MRLRPASSAEIIIAWPAVRAVAASPSTISSDVEIVCRVPRIADVTCSR
ncbi:hypothetical protein QZM67_09140 [Burkholderia sp. AU45251]|nr:hypothetical protein [Burkholderia sp. AU45251]MDN7515307.1 hypothetical protein [Burkholderia sp. AU45251]